MLLGSPVVWSLPLTVEDRVVHLLDCVLQLDHNAPYFGAHHCGVVVADNLEDVLDGGDRLLPIRLQLLGVVDIDSGSGRGGLKGGVVIKNDRLHKLWLFHHHRCGSP